MVYNPHTQRARQYIQDNQHRAITLPLKVFDISEFIRLRLNHLRREIIKIICQTYRGKFTKERRKLLRIYDKSSKIFQRYYRN